MTRKIRTEWKLKINNWTEETHKDLLSLFLYQDSAVYKWYSSEKQSLTDLSWFEIKTKLLSAFNLSSTETAAKLKVKLEL